MKHLKGFNETVKTEKTSNKYLNITCFYIKTRNKNKIKIFIQKCKEQGIELNINTDWEKLNYKGVGIFIDINKSYNDLRIVVEIIENKYQHVITGDILYEDEMSKDWIKIKGYLPGYNFIDFIKNFSLENNKIRNTIEKRIKELKDLNII